jgi:hypothetical protein
MKSLLKIGMLLSAFFLVSCETEMVERLDEFSFEQGGYMRTVTPFPIPIFSVKSKHGGYKHDHGFRSGNAYCRCQF